MKTRAILLSLIISGIYFTSGWAQPKEQVQFRVQPESKLWFDGTSTLHDFTCEVKEISGFLTMDSKILNETLFDIRNTFSQGLVSIKAIKIESGKKKMDSKMQKALKTKTYPQITYELISFENIVSTDSSEGWIQLQTSGKLTIAGTERLIEMTINSYFTPDGLFRFKGSKTLLMTDFGIKPPKFMFGTIKTGNEIDVHFDLIMAPDIQL